MPNANIYFDNYEDTKIRKLAAQWDISKNEAVKKMVREFKVKEMRANNDL